jgi:Zn-dependent M28 family amino/carboxypeptidase
VSPIRASRRGWMRAAAVAGGVALVAGVVSAPATANNGVNNTSKKLRAAVSAEGMLEHLQAFQDIADANNDTRVSGTDGYDESVEYAADVFRDAGYTVTIQPFEFQTFIQLTPPVLEQVAPTPSGPVANNIMAYSGSGDVTASVTALPAAPADATPGCEAGDFAGFPAGNIALISRGACAFAIKATNAYDAGAAGVVIYNNIAGELNGTLGNDFTLDIPVTSVTQAIGEQLAATAGLVLRLKTDTFRGIATTYNVLAESKAGDPDNVVMAGAHLDSVNEGPGIHDNGSGSAAILEIAKQMEKVKPKNKVRFALWGAEESGLVGSIYYVNNLSQAERERIALYLNFDMIASPNYVRFVYDGDNSAFPVGPGAAAGPAGSDAIEQLFHDYFASVGLASAETAFSGRSDYGPFIAEGVGIPSGGLFTGAEGLKTAEEAAVFGGLEGVAYDPCYHQACDALTQSFASGDERMSQYQQLADEYRMVGNVNMDALEEMGDAVAHAVITYAFDTRTVNGTGKGRPASPPGQQVTGVPVGVSSPTGGGLHDHDHELDES